MTNVQVKNIPLNPGTELRITGVPHDNPERFAINVGTSERDIALHFNPRFHQGDDNHIIVLNSMKDGIWAEEVKESYFPFKPGQMFEVTITFTGDMFYINLHDGHMLQFPNRLAARQYDYIETHADVVIKYINIQ